MLVQQSHRGWRRKLQTQVFPLDAILRLPASGVGVGVGVGAGEGPVPSTYQTICGLSSHLLSCSTCDP